MKRILVCMLLRNALCHTLLLRHTFTELYYKYIYDIINLSYLKFYHIISYFNVNLEKDLFILMSLYSFCTSNNSLDYV